MYQKLLCILFFGFFVLPIFHNTAIAQTQIGAGLAKCALYNQLQDQKADPTYGIELWVLGYLSGINFIHYIVKNEDFLIRQNSEVIISFLKGYCRANPGKTIANASNELWPSWVNKK